MSTVCRPRHPLHIHMAAMAPDFMDVRTTLPLRELARVPSVTVSASERKIEFPRLPAEQPKLLIAQRGRVPNPAVWTDGVAKLVGQGWLLVAEYDDHPDLIGSISAQKSSETRWMSLRSAHAIQTSTPLLAETFKSYNPEVAVFANAAFDVVPVVRPPRPDGHLRVFFGAFNRERFSARIGAALAAYGEKHPEVEFIVLRDRAFFESLGGARKTFSEALPYGEYLNALAGCDVALMPLEGIEGERFKSDLKFVEAASVGVASIVSPVIYGESVEHEVTALIAREVEDWAEALARLHRDLSLRAALARAARDLIASKRMFEHQVQARLDWYCDLWDRRHPLTRSLGQRLQRL